MLLGVLVNVKTLNKRIVLETAIVGIILLAIAFFFIRFFEQIPPQTGWPIDWPAFWQAMRYGNLSYASVDGLRPPPWSMLPLLPLGFVSMRAGWALLSLLSLIALILSVPRRRFYWLGILLLVVSFPTARVLVDGNFEALIVGGVVLALYGFNRLRPLALAAGVILATFKPQAVFLLLLVLAVELVRHWPRRDLIRFAGFTAAVVVPAMLWRGQDWLLAMFGQNFGRYTGSLIDVTLIATLRRLGFDSPALIGVVWLGFVGLTLYAAFAHSSNRFDRTKASLLTAGSLLAAPYAAGNSLLVPYALGVIPLLFVKPLPALVLVVLVNLSFVLNRPENVGWLAYYNTGLLLILWGVMLWQIRNEQRSGRAAARSADAV